jgi:hypothetical protein
MEESMITARERQFENPRQYVVLYQAIRHLHFPSHTPIVLRMLPRNRTGEPRAGKDIRALGVLDKSSSRVLVRLSNGNHRVAMGRRPTVKDSSGDVHNGQSRGVLLFHLAAQSKQSPDVVVVVVREDHFLHTGEVDVQFAGILQDGLGARTSIHENPMTIGFDERRKTPFADPRRFRHKHGREHSHFESRICVSDVLDAWSAKPLEPLPAPDPGLVKSRKAATTAI